MKITDVVSEIESKAQRAKSRPEAPGQSGNDSAGKPAAPVRQTPAAPPVEVRKIESVTKQIDSFLRSMNKSLQFRVDESTGRTIVSICDAETGEVIRQVPGDEALRIAQNLENRLSGMLDEKV
jgi:flagellar protein FlaG